MLGPFRFWEKGFEEIESRVELPLRDELELHHFAFLLGLAFVEAARVSNHGEVLGPITIMFNIPIPPTLLLPNQSRVSDVSLRHFLQHAHHFPLGLLPPDLDLDQRDIPLHGQVGSYTK